MNKPNGNGSTSQMSWRDISGDTDDKFSFGNISIRNQVNNSKQFSYKPESANTPVNCVLEPEYIEMVDYLCIQHSVDGKPVKRQAMVKSLLKFALNKA
tara:strand:+ start:450 stop:743 length:294 start_codon:yes stop_codon:yes gene_type:complete